MSRITKNRSEYYKRRMKKLFEDAPESKYVRNRHRTTRYILLEKYKWIENIPKDEMLTFLRESVYVERILRLETESIEPTTKKILSQQFIVEELDYQIGQRELQFK